MIRYLLVLSLIAAGAAQPAAAQPSSFRTAFDDFVRADGVLGASYFVLDHGRLVDSEAFGMADTSLKQPVDRNTVYHWGSITKTLTAVAIMQLRDRGKISLDDPILKYVPELARVHSENNGIARVTLRHLLSHTAGFQGPTWPYGDGKPWQPFEPADWSQLVAMMPYQELAFEPGTRYQYSNPAYIYLARVIEAVTGDPFQVYVQKNILTPLGMTRTFYNVSPYHLAADRSNSYGIQTDEQGRETIKIYGREFDTGITTPNGGLNAPLDDMAKWVGFLSGPVPASGVPPVLDRGSLEEMWRPVAPVIPEKPRFPQSIGLGFFLYPRGAGDKAVTFIGHTGSQAGFRSFFVMNSKNGRAVIAVFNTAPEEAGTGAAKKRLDEWAARFRSLLERAIETVR